MRRDDDFQPFKRWFPWLVPTISVTTIAMFIITMFVNDCPKNSVSCLARFLGRFSFQPFKENPLLGPSSDTLTKMGALDVTLVIDRHQVWRLLSSIWLHAGVFHLLANMLSLVFIGLQLEQEFGFVRIGLVYLISGFGGNLLSALFIQFTISVGASGALFGLLGAMLSELVTNWTIYDNKLATFLTLIVVIVINLAMGLLPHVDNFAHIGGFLSGFLIGFMLLIRPQFGYISQKHAHPRSIIISSARPKYKPYQFVLWISSALLLTTCLTVALIMLLRGVNANDHCSWCHYLSCVSTSKWSCNSKLLCESVQFGGKFNLTCLSNGRSRVYPLTDDKSSQVRQLCSQLCG